MPRRRHAPLVMGLTLATLFAAALGARSLVRARQTAPAPSESTSATPGPAPTSTAAHATSPGLDPPANPIGPAAPASAPSEAPVPDEIKPARAAPTRRSKAALARESRERAKRGARGGRAARGASLAEATVARKPASGRAAAGDQRAPGGLVASKSALTADPPAPPPPLDISRAGVSIGAISSTSAIPSSNIRSALSRAPWLHCYREALRTAGAAAAGTAVLRLKIDVAGYVTGTQLEGAHFLPGVKACVEQAARGARIKDVDTGEGSADITLNFTYSP